MNAKLNSFFVFVYRRRAILFNEAERLSASQSQISMTRFHWLGPGLAVWRDPNLSRCLN